MDTDVMSRDVVISSVMGCEGCVAAGCTEVAAGVLAVAIGAVVCGWAAVCGSVSCGGCVKVYVPSCR